MVGASAGAFGWHVKPGDRLWKCLERDTILAWASSCRAGLRAHIGSFATLVPTPGMRQDHKQGDRVC